MRTLTIRLPLSIAQQLDDNGQLNPATISNILDDYMSRNMFVDNEQGTTELLFTYSFKVKEDLHDRVKYEAGRNGLSISTYVRRLFELYY